MPPTATPPADPCLACDASAWFLASDWPTPGTSSRLCRICTSRPSLFPHYVAAGLSDADRAQLRAEAEAGDYSAGLTLAAVATSLEPAAWLLYSRRLGLELWLARDAAALELIRDELAGRPVIMAEELAALRTLNTHALRAVLDAKAAFPSSRLFHAVPEAQEGSP